VVGEWLIEFIRWVVDEWLIELRGELLIEWSGSTLIANKTFLTHLLTIHLINLINDSLIK